MDLISFAFSLLGAGAGRSLVEAGSSRGEQSPAEDSASDRPRVLEPAEAASRFVEFVRDQQLHGTHMWAGGRGIWALYLWFCEEDQVAPLPENTFARELGRIVSKKQVRVRVKGKLHRPTVYVIEP